ncbi:MAG: hypothetical protein HY974_03645 [Candidatus Kerfeldbacteria bacterium]|nr:hypothetical protein [Candidatus Kerfeldbacteria bacterium]
MSPLQQVSANYGRGGQTQTTGREHLTTAGVFLSLLLGVTLVGLGQRGLYDLNRLYNPHYQVCNQARYILSGGDSCPVETYAFKTVLLHSYLSLPLFLIFLGLMLYLRTHRLNTWQKAMFRVSNGVAIFFGVEFLLELIIYLFQYHRIVGWYFSLTVTATLLIVLVIYIERRAARKKAASGHH